MLFFAIAVGAAAQVVVEVGRYIARRAPGGLGSGWVVGGFLAGIVVMNRAHCGSLRRTFAGSERRGIAGPSVAVWAHDASGRPVTMRGRGVGSALRGVDVRKVYADGTEALRGVSFDIPAGSVFGLLGPNGSGKSTLIGMVSGLVRGPAGSIFVFGFDAIADASAARLEVGVAPQDVHLDRFLRVRDVLTYHGRYFGMASSAAAERADELLAVFDLTAKARARPNRLSGGMRRRLLIARALMHRPRLLILDEPTAGVDLELRRELWAYLLRLHEHEDATILLTTHYLEEAEALCDRVAFIRAGRILAEGSVALIERFGGSHLEDAYVAAMS